MTRASRAPAGRKARGYAAEAIARAYLELRGYTIVAANVRDGPRELDLVVEQGALVVFVEVKFRGDDRFGGVRRALAPAQRLELERAAVAWLKATGRAGRPVRFDLVGIEFSGGDGLTLAHFPGAFGGSGRFVM